MKNNSFSYDNNKKIKQNAISYLKVLKTSDNYSYVELNPITGRKHQIRKHLVDLSCPIVGDKKYYLKKKIVKSQLMLHAYEIKFILFQC